ncbi:TRAP transporter permease [Veillonellaceae bacterium WCA-693-APC-5D-A]|uniref:TRAP transporter permease n=1 Tax=Anaerovibrio slackiae TaxID=2652309 RepID=A0A6I2UBT8_9FIRM|nr:TRAP transporter permease [Anaerovibrio slackiae]MBQ5920356.1 TRAP transporter permease [Selenomonadaceae bacterium]MBR0328717.1 TRAP transporter permease [Selenomonadaceae bacterium]MCI6097394.1 TRAP transporter permease [Selenomonadaceae bacterium]MCI6483372.1 TRAP transporter permease [Selenomonadaceae bacterium]MDD6162994.1 TRAP transporter permease [Anaerovibrio slackiae]
MALDKKQPVTSDEALAQEVLKKYDRESDTMQYTGFMAKIISAIAISFSVFQLYTAFFGVLDAQLQRAVHLGFALALSYLLYPTCKSWSRSSLHPLDALLAVLGAASPAYIVIMYRELAMRAGMITTPDLVVGVIGVLLVIEATRRVVGIPMVVVVTAFIVYAFAGPHMPGVLSHRGLTPEQLVGHLYFTTEGIFGIPLGVSSTFIFLFILFGAYLESTGLGKFFIDIANAIAGWASGGPAKVAVLSSALMGTVSGSSVANVAGTGSFTIPMMKKLGYRKEFAGAVEAASSTGGQLMPPVMGAAAFLMAEFVGVPYIEIVEAAVIPAMLYFAGLWLGVHLEAKRTNLKGVPREQLPKAWVIFKERGHLAIPLIVIVYLLVTGYTPMRAALVAIVLSIAVSALKKSTRMKPIEIIRGLEAGARNVLGVAIACAAAGIIIGVVTKTGVGLKLASGLLALSGGYLLPTMFFTMITSLILGMGVPTTANYVITSTIAAPALLQMGVPVLAAHMFVFYFGIIADVTPPVALAAYAASGISGGKPLITGVNASKLAIAAFIIPYIFVLSPEILMINATVFSLIFAAVTAILGMVGVSSAMIGYLVDHSSPVERVLQFVGGILMIMPGVWTDIPGFIIFVLVVMWQSRRKKKHRTA